MRLIYQLVIFLSVLLMTGCLGADIAADIVAIEVMSEGVGRHCPLPPSEKSMIPNISVLTANRSKIEITSVVGVVQDNVKPFQTSFGTYNPPPDCWVVTGIDATIFEKVLKESLISAGYVYKDSEIQAYDLVMNTQMLEQIEDEDFHGFGNFARKAQLTVRYSLKKPNEENVVWNKDITTKGEVRWGAFVNNSPKESEVTGIAFELAIKSNLEILIHDLSESF